MPIETNSQNKLKIQFCSLWTKLSINTLINNIHFSFSHLYYKFILQKRQSNLLGTIFPTESVLFLAQSSLFSECFQSFFSKYILFFNSSVHSLQRYYLSPLSVSVLAPGLARTIKFCPKCPCRHRSLCWDNHVNIMIVKCLHFLFLACYWF